MQMAMNETIGDFPELILGSNKSSISSTAQ
jgi:hypothetical protein